MSRAAHLARLNGRLIEVRARESQQAETLACTRSEAAALETEIEYLSRGTGPAAWWNDAHGLGAPVYWLAGGVGGRVVETVTRSRAWMGENGEAVVTVQGSLLPVPLTDLQAVSR